jgi:hypothetical protein
VLKLVFIFRSGYNHIGDAAQIGDIESTLMRLAIVANDAAAVNGEDYRQILDAHIVNDLIKGPLEEGRVNGNEGNEPLSSQSGSEGDGMLLTNAGIEDTLGEFASSTSEASSVNHGSGDGHYPAILQHQAKGSSTKDFAIGWGGAGPGAIGRYAVKLDRVGFGQRIAFALFGQDVNEGRFGFMVSGPAQGCLKLLDVVTIHWAEVDKAKALPEGAWD